MRDYYAHSLPDHPWESLEDHLNEVARRASEFASAWGACEWGRLAGLWHDLGKYSEDFQNYLLSANGLAAHIEQAPGRVNHSTAGAIHARAAFKETFLGDLLAYVIIGHHGGLPDDRDVGGLSGLFDRILKPPPSIKPPAEITTNTTSPQALSGTFPPFKSRSCAPYQVAFFTRMLFSALVDADFLATEAVMSPDRGSARGQSIEADWPAWDRRLSAHIEAVAAERSGDGCALDLLQARTEILNDCRDAARLPPGLFSLTVPTGGGKTLASLAFAVRHAAGNALRRVVYAIPFTSIIEQTAETFRGALGGLGDNFVLEHHVNLDPEKETPWSRLAAENWDAPLVVTTNVQLFESLHAARPSACRKLHRLAKSVLILDEVQALPVHLLAPCLAALQELVDHYGCTVVLCTATRPALHQRENFKEGLVGVREIARDPTGLSDRLRRVSAEVAGPLDDATLIGRIAVEPRALCIVNTRPHAARLFQALTSSLGPNEKSSYFHLSTRLCGAHRADVLKKIRSRLALGKPCRVVSTQLVEAGVDLDFPVVFRALAGVDSLVQAAGRCNREGRHATGRLVVFDPVEVKPPPSIAVAIDSTREVLAPGVDPLSPDTVEAFFCLHFWRHHDKLDRPKVLTESFALSQHAALFKFRTVADAFQMIDDVGVPVVVPYGDAGLHWIERVRSPEPLRREDYRQLQRYTVSVPRAVCEELRTRGALLSSEEGRPEALTEGDLYDKRLGLRVDDLAENPRDVADFMF